ncbi:MAG: gfo/Idh/MocA family oxidoreductase [Caldilineae bacterium]|nr:MAG: gfo/Idh/MocA family oxidoreductase [Caldilineae bacterium]
MKPIRWGILGPGNIAKKFATGLAALEDADLLAVASRSRERADAFADQFGAPRRYTAYEDLVNDPDVDIIYVATPHSYHMEHTLLSLDAGKPVLCEKPFAINAKQAQRMVDRAQEQGLFLMEAMWTRFLPHMQALKRRIEDGQIGQVRIIEADFCFNSRVNPASRLYDPALGGGALLDVGVYPVSLAHWMLGDPARVATLAHLGETGVDEIAGMLLGYPEGALAVLTTAIRANTHHTATISGATGRIVVHERWWAPATFTVFRDGHEPEHVEPPLQGNGYNYQAAACMACLREGRQESDVMPWSDTLAIMRLLDQLRAEWGLRYPMEEE